MEHRLKKRWLYLLTKAGLETTSAVGILTTLVFAVLALGFFLGTLGAAILWYKTLFLLSFGLTVLFSVLTYGSYKVCVAVTDMSKHLPDVRPVREQVAGLPADEVLLRGADPPAASAGDLLRVAHERTETAATELLRPEQRS